MIVQIVTTCCPVQCDDFPIMDINGNGRNVMICVIVQIFDFDFDSDCDCDCDCADCDDLLSIVMRAKPDSTTRGLNPAL